RGPRHVSGQEELGSRAMLLRRFGRPQGWPALLRRVDGVAPLGLKLGADRPRFNANTNPMVPFHPGQALRKPVLASPALPEEDVPKMPIYNIGKEWVVIYTKEGRPYYHNHVTKATTWAHPRTGVITPPMRPPEEMMGMNPLLKTFLRGGFGFVGIVGNPCALLIRIAVQAEFTCARLLHADPGEAKIPPANLTAPSDDWCTLGFGGTTEGPSPDGARVSRLSSRRRVSSCRAEGSARWLRLSPALVALASCCALAVALASLLNDRSVCFCAFVGGRSLLPAARSQLWATTRDEDDWGLSSWESGVSVRDAPKRDRDRDQASSGGRPDRDRDRDRGGDQGQRGDRGDRGPRSFDRGPKRSFGDDGAGGDRGQRSFDRGPKRNFGDDGASRTSRKPKGDWDRGDRDRGNADADRLQKAPPAPIWTEKEKEAYFRRMIKEPVTLTTVIKRCESASELCRTLSKVMAATSLNTIHVSAAFSMLASMKKPFNETVMQHPALVDLSSQAARLAARRAFGAREAASVITSMASLRITLPWIAEEVAPSILKQVPSLVDKMTPQALSNTIWGIGVLDLDSRDADVALRAAGDTALAQLGRFSTMDLAQTAWGLGARGQRGDADALLEALGNFVADLAPTMESKAALFDLPQIAMSFAKVGFWHPRVMDAIALRLAPSMEMKQLRLWGLAALVWTWSQPVCPWFGEGQAADYKSKGRARKGRQPVKEYPDQVLPAFLSKLQREAERRRLTPQDIDLSPQGPKSVSCAGW
ncbi:unnamed protein product, partial [Polarella glacialis]